MSVSGKQGLNWPLRMAAGDGTGSLVGGSSGPEAWSRELR